MATIARLPDRACASSKLSSRLPSGLPLTVIPPARRRREFRGIPLPRFAPLSKRPKHAKLRHKPADGVETFTMNTCAPPRRHSRKSPGDCPPNKRPFHSLEEIVQDYIDNCRPRAKCEMEYFGDHTRTMPQAIRIAALAINCKGKRHSHQRRIPRDKLKRFRLRLLRRSKALRSCKSFHELMAITEKVAAGIWRHSELTVYDTTHRIGALLGPRPKYVYLHAGTREGAKALGFKGTVPFTLPREFPKPFRKLKPYEIEDCLCIYKDALKLLRHR